MGEEAAPSTNPEKGRAEKRKIICRPPDDMLTVDQNMHKCMTLNETLIGF